MKSLLRAFTLVGLLCFSSLSMAEKWSCDELTELANDLDTIADAFDEAGTIREGDDIDQALGDIVDAIVLIADIENQSALNRSVDNLIKAYNDMDSDMFAMALDSVITNLDRLYRRDC